MWAREFFEGCGRDAARVEGVGVEVGEGELVELRELVGVEDMGGISLEGVTMKAEGVRQLVVEGLFVACARSGDFWGMVRGLAYATGSAWCDCAVLGWGTLVQPAPSETAGLVVRVCGRVRGEGCGEGF